MLFFTAREEFAMASSDKKNSEQEKQERKGKHIPQMTEDTGQIFRALHH